MATRRKRIFLAVMGIAIALFIASLFVVSNQYPTAQTAKLEFTLPDEFSKVRRILISTGATKQIITMAGDNEFVDESWSSIGGSFNPFKSMHLELHGTMTVQSNDEYVGKPIVELTQDTRISKDEVHAHAKMAKPDKRLLDYDLVTHFERNKESANTIVRLSQTQEVLTTAPWFAHRIADRRVYESAERALQNQKRAILQLIKENR